jgi:hypothetical protein
MIYAVEMASCGMKYLPSFIKIGTVVQAILRFNSAVSVAVMLVLLVEAFYGVRR